MRHLHPLLSVIVPVYNTERYLTTCLESILDQIYSNIEVIVVDDGSTDESGKICDEIAKRDSRVTVIHKDNAGLSSARNIGIQVASGKYIAFVDSDDYLRKDTLEKLINTALETNSDIVISNYYLYFHDGNDIKHLKHMPKKKTYSNNEVINLMLLNRIQGHVWNKLFKYSLLNKINFEFEKDRIIEDIFPIFKAVNSASKIVYIDEALYFYRQREESLVNKRNKKLTEDYHHAAISIIKYIKENKIKVKEESLRAFKAEVFSYFIYHYTNEDIKNNYKSFKKSKYNNLNMNLKEFIFLKEVNLQDKLRIVLWKLGLFNFIKKVKRKI